MSFLVTVLLIALVIFLGYYFNMLWISVLVAIVLFIILTSGKPQRRPAAKTGNAEQAAGPQTVIIQQAPETRLWRGNSKFDPIYMYNQKEDSLANKIAKPIGWVLGAGVKAMWLGLKALLGERDEK